VATSSGFWWAILPPGTACLLKREGRSAAAHREVPPPPLSQRAAQFSMTHGGTWDPRTPRAAYAFRRTCLELADEGTLGVDGSTFAEEQTLCEILLVEGLEDVLPVDTAKQRQGLLEAVLELLIGHRLRGAHGTSEGVRVRDVRANAKRDASPFEFVTSA